MRIISALLLIMNIIDLNKLLYADHVELASGRLWIHYLLKTKEFITLVKLNFYQIFHCFWKLSSHSNKFQLTFSCSAKSYACFSASRARLSLSFNENIATERARLMRLCFTRDFLAASSAAVKNKGQKLVVFFGQIYQHGMIFDGNFVFNSMPNEYIFV